MLLSPLGMKDKLFYGWVVVIACFALNAVVFGTRYSFGVFFKSIQSQFELNRAQTSVVFSAYMLLCAGVAMLGGWAFDRYGPRKITFLMGIFTGSSLLLTSQTNSLWQLFISYSLLLALGTGAVYAVLMSTISRWFDRKRGLALGIAGSGVGFGTVIMAPFTAYLISSFDWRVAFVVLGLIAGVIIASLSMLLKKDPGEVGALPDGVKSVSGGTGIQDKQGSTQTASLLLLQAFKSRSFWLLWGMWLLSSLSFHIVYTHIVAHATDLLIPDTKAAAVLGLIGLISAPSRLVMGGVSDRIGRKLSAAICALLQAGAIIWLIWARDLWMFYLFAVVYGLGYGGMDAPTVAMVGDIFGLRNIGVIMGATVVGWGIGAAIGPVIAGFIFDASRSYSAAFSVGALAMLLATLLVAFIGRGMARSV